jgi:hypothetical protein
VLNRFVCRSEEKIVIANEIVGFSEFECFLKIILSELIVKCVIGFGRFVRI